MSDEKQKSKCGRKPKRPEDLRHGYATRFSLTELADLQLVASLRATTAASVVRVLVAEELQRLKAAGKVFESPY